jgi:hypothetical protein
MITIMPLLVVAMAPAGFALGLGYFAAIRRTAALLAGGGGWLPATALTLGRFGVAALLFGLAARLGWPALLALFAGFLCARPVALRLMGRS